VPSNHNLAPGERACVCSWGSPVTLDGRLLGYLLELEEGWGAFDALGELLGVRQRRPSAISLVSMRIVDDPRRRAVPMVMANGR
jgi:hypothetical protein